MKSELRVLVDRVRDARRSDGDAIRFGFVPTGERDASARLVSYLLAHHEVVEAFETIMAIAPMLREHAAVGDQLWREDQIAAMDEVAIEIVRVLHQSKLADRLAKEGER